MALSLAQVGRAAEAEKIVDAFLKESPTDPWVRWICANSLAMTRGNLVELTRCHDKAIGLLEAMIADGWRDFVAIRTEPTLDGLRNYPRFAKLTSGAEVGK